MPHYDFDHDVDFGWVAHEGLGVVLEDVARFEDALDGAGFDVELVVAEAVAPVALCQLDMNGRKEYTRVERGDPTESMAVATTWIKRKNAYLSSGLKFQSVTAP